MIPAAILNGLWKFGDCELEFSIQEVSTDGFLVRLAKRHEAHWEKQKGEITLRFFLRSQGGYKEIPVSDFQLITEEELQYFQMLYVAVAENKEYVEAVKQLTREYLDYIRLFTEEDMAVVSQELTGYPAEYEDVYPDSYQELNRKLASEYALLSKLNQEQGIIMDSPWQWEKYLAMEFEEYIDWYFHEKGFAEILVNKESIRYIYLGSQVCAHLFPGEEILQSLIRKGKKDGMRIVLQLPPVKESRWEMFERILKDLPQFCMTLGIFHMEVVVNDWGMLSFLSELPFYEITMGILLLKQKKDPRMKWKKEYCELAKEQRKTGWMTAEFSGRVYEKYRVTRFSVEETGIEYGNLPMKCTCYLPWYQMNTATLCPLTAAVESEDRSAQKEQEFCRYLCKDWIFLYPIHLQMCGRYNTLWGYQIPEKEAPGKGADRIVWNF